MICFTLVVISVCHIYSRDNLRQSDIRIDIRYQLACPVGLASIIRPLNGPLPWTVHSSYAGATAPSPLLLYSCSFTPAPSLLLLLSLVDSFSPFPAPALRLFLVQQFSIISSLQHLLEEVHQLVIVLQAAILFPQVPVQWAGLGDVPLLLPLLATPAEPVGPGKPPVVAEISCHWQHAHSGGKVRPYLAGHLLSK